VRYVVSGIRIGKQILNVLKGGFEMKMKRLSMRGLAVCLGLLLVVSMVVVGCPPPPPDDEVPPPPPPVAPIRWRMQAFAPKVNPLVINSQEFFVEVVEKLSGGRLIIESYGAGEIVPAMGVRPAVTAGVIEMGKWWSGFDAGLDPVHMLFGTAVPFGLRHEDLLAWYLRGGGKELKAELYAPLNITIPVVFVEAAGPALHMIEPWDTLEELKGKTMRVLGLQAEVFKRLGIGTSGIPGGEIYAALAAGLIHGAEWAGPILNEAFGFHEPAPYMLTPGWHEPALLTMFIVNDAAWRALPADLQYIVKMAGYATYTHYRQFTFYENALSLQKQLAEGGVLIRLPEADMKLLEDTTMKVLEEFAARDAFFAEVLKSQRDFMKFMEPMRGLDDF
jgi:TRAP-type mannitol/chloroaromatic compound transport system substrate-binding protein